MGEPFEHEGRDWLCEHDGCNWRFLSACLLAEPFEHNGWDGQWLLLLHLAEAFEHEGRPHGEES